MTPKTKHKRPTKAERARMAAQLARDARNRAWRAFLQGLAIDVGVAVATVVATYTTSVEAWQGWAVIGFSVGRTVLSSAASYVMRRYLDGSKVPTPTPPAVPGEPDDDTPVEE